jgi:DNA (cytosine-5)-methyltransferase 1
MQALRNLKVDNKHVFSCDNDPFVRQTIQNNFQPEKLYKDITTRQNTTAPYVDIYIAGFPCQPFSVAGKREGFDDAKGRGSIFFDIRNYIQIQKPKVFILENVKGILNRENGGVVKRIMRLLNNIKRNGKRAYKIKYEIMDTQDHGLPQSRSRWYCVGIREDTTEEEYFEFPTVINCPSIENFWIEQVTLN